MSSNKIDIDRLSMEVMRTLQNFADVTLDDMEVRL